jgi:hypothetical protein
MNVGMTWTTPDELRAQLQRCWDRGELLSPVERTPSFPMALRLRRPTPRDLSERFEEVRVWIRTLEAGAVAGYEIVWSEINHRQLGPNRVPSGIVVATLDDAHGLIGKRRAAARYAALVAQTEAACPALCSWVRRHPLVALEQADDWERLLAVVNWFAAHPRPGIYLRQLDIAGVDTKFVEARRGLMAALLDEVLPASAVASEHSPLRQFEARYGLRSKPATIRFRLLDDALAIHGMTDVSTPASAFARLRLPVERVFISENEINALALPPAPRSLVIFGLGYGLDRLGNIDWLRDAAVWYWGDIDTHGFAMLDRLRALIPAARSFLMDEETLLAHRPAWGREDVQHDGALGRLTPSEHRVFDGLRTDAWAPHLRLEQERIGFAWVERAIAIAVDVAR